jgi:hypothetical protein
MGQIRDRTFAWKKRDTKRRDREFTIPMEKPKVAAVPSPEDPLPKQPSNVRLSNDGFWTTQHPAAKAFSVEWFRIHLAMIPYFWAMIRMAMSVSKLSVAIVGFGTVGRAVVDAAQLYAYTRFVNEVPSLKFRWNSNRKAQNAIVHQNCDLEKLCLLALLTPLLQVADRVLMQAMYLQFSYCAF